MSDSALPAGTEVSVIKLRPDGSEAARYPGVIVDPGETGTWIAVRAFWTLPRVNAGGLIFAPGDTLHEYFSAEHWFNVFAIFAADGMFRGWYANVAYPARIDVATTPVSITWHDLFVDVVSQPDGSTVVLDEDELDRAGLQYSDAPKYQRIMNTRDMILRLIQDRRFPFHDPSEVATRIPTKQTP